MKIFAIIALSILATAACLYAAYLIVTSDAKLDPEKLVGAGQSVIICDENGNEITDASLEIKSRSVKVENLASDTVNAFIASEDRTFFKHNGLNYKRMLKALYRNITSRSFKEGASTISQQLIKNTHLSNDKTISRKLKEIKLTKKLEKNYSKNDILEMYLNTIYFGHNCYGLQSAAQFYFGKKAENLELTESATIVGLLSSPNNYSPFKNPEKSLARRNLVLKSMLDCDYIDENTYNSAKESPLNAVENRQDGGYGDYVSAVFDELDEIDFDFYSLSDGYIIKTYMDADMQRYIENIEFPCDNSVIITDNATGGVKAYKSTVGGAKRQPGSTIKPLFVYAPAIEERQINYFTKILDEKIDYNGYSPENYDKKYHGYVTVADSIANSYNIPAVKTLNALTIGKAEKYIKKMNLSLDGEEKNLALALGGMKYGLSLKEIADRYSIFPRGGNYRPSRFIKEIISKDGKTIYAGKTPSDNVFSAGTCSIMNEMLERTTKEGTAKKLKNFDFDIASKTGTCGTQDGNTDAYAVCYTSEHCLAVWLGDRENRRAQITGGGDCCKIMKGVMQTLYSDRTPAPLDTESGTTKINVDREEYSENNKILLADDICPKLNILTLKVLKGNDLYAKSNKFSSPSIPSPQISVKNNAVSIELCHAKYYSFLINRAKNEQKDIIYDGKWKNSIVDEPDDGTYVYSVTPYYDDGKSRHYGKEIILPPVNIAKESPSPDVKIPDIAKKDWFNL